MFLLAVLTETKKIQFVGNNFKVHCFSDFILVFFYQGVVELKNFATLRAYHMIMMDTPVGTLISFLPITKIHFQGQPTFS